MLYACRQLLIFGHLTAFLGLSASVLLAQNAPPEAPPALVFPWQVIGIPAERAQRSGDILRQATGLFIQGLLDQPKPLLVARGDTWRQNLTANTKIALTGIITGSPKQGNDLPPLSFEPIWCTVREFDVFFLTVTHTIDNQLLAAPHIAIRRPPNPKASGRTAPLAPLTTDMAQRLIAQTIQMPRDQTFPDNSSALHLELTLAEESTRADEGSNYCLNMLLASQLLSRYPISRPAANEPWATVRRALTIQTKPLRATRKLLLHWQHPPQETGPTLQYTAKITLIESVLGQKSPWPTNAITMKLDPTPEKSLAITIDPTLKQALDIEKLALATNTQPQVVHIQGAWAYLDKGRAWGLHMDDRLIAQTTPQGQIKGHVVGFFGPELGLKSPAGYPIREGAILYIRKGQRNLHQGMTFAYDPTTFPTPWPPVSKK